MVLLVLPLLWAPSSPAATVTFGADLNRPADNPLVCGRTLIFFTSTGCSITSVNIATGESGFPPAGEGTVSAVRVRVGPVTGPMRIVVEQALRQDNPFEPGKPNYACCSVVAMSPVFTPTANAITQIPVNFRVRQDLTPDENGLYVDQHLALSVLDPSVPIPAALDANSSFSVWVPAWQSVGEQRVNPAGNSGLNVLMNADWDPVGAPAAPVAPVAPGAVPALSIPNGQALVRNARARLALACALDTACAGRVLLQSRRANAARPLVASSPARAKAARAVTYGSARFRIGPGKSSVLKVKLNRKGKRLMRGQGRPKVWVNVSMKGQTITPRRITLKPAPRKPRG